MRNYIALAIPFFFVFIAVELLVARAKKRHVYRLGDAVTDLSCGIQQQVLLVFERAAQAAVYAWAYEHRLATLPAWADWLLAWVGVDFIYYFWHRASHEVNFLWAANVVHHQSEDYNLAVALRQSILTGWTSLAFYLPLAFAGVSLPAFATAVAFSTLYQFWIHTELVGKVRGPIDWILNLPSHHRVHHAINPRYLDKNYGAILIVWDRLFGTYAEEIEAPVFGITKPLASYNPLWAQIHYWFDMAHMARRAHGADKLRVLWKSPAWKPRGQELPPPAEITPAQFVKYDPKLTRARGVRARAVRGARRGDVRDRDVGIEHPAPGASRRRDRDHRHGALGRRDRREQALGDPRRGRAPRDRGGGDRPMVQDGMTLRRVRGSSPLPLPLRSGVFT